MSDLTYGIRLNGNASNLRAELNSAGDGFDRLQKQTDALSASTGKMANSYTGLNSTLKQHDAAVTETGDKVNKLLDRYDPLGAKLRQLQSDFKALDAAAAGGKIGARDDGRVDQVYARMQAEINAASAAANNFGNVATGAMQRTGQTAGQLRMATQQLPMQFTDIWVSLAAGQNPMTVAMQQGSQIKDSFGGAGAAAQALGGYVLGMVNPLTITAAAVAAGGYAWYEYKFHVSNLREELKLLSGDLDLKTNKQLSDRFKELELAVADKRAQASSGGWGWKQEAEDARVMEEELRRVGKQLDANRRLEERLGDVGGEASRLARESSSAKRRELERLIGIMQIYHDKQVVGSNQEIDSLNKINELKKNLAEQDNKRDEDAKRLLEASKRAEQKIINDLNASGAAQVKSATDALAAQQLHNEQIGLSKMELADLSARRLVDAAATNEQAAANIRAAASMAGPYHDVYLQEARDLEAVAAAQRANVAALRDGAAKQATVDAAKAAADAQAKASADAAKASADAWNRASDRISTDITGALMRGFESGKGFAQNLADTVTNLFKSMVLEPTVKAIVVTGMSAIGMGPTNAAANSLMGSGVAGAGLGVAGSALSVGLSAGMGASASYAGAALSSGSYASAIGFGAAAAAPVVAGLLIAKYGFGWGNTKENVGDQRLVGQFNRQGFGGNYQQDWKIDGGWFGSDKRGTDVTAVTTAQSRAFRATVDGLKTTFDGLGAAIGDNSVATREWKVQVNQAGDVTRTLTDSMGIELIPALEKFQLTGESLAQTAQRLTGVFQGTSYFITALGLDSQQAFGAFGIQSAAQRDTLIKSFSGDTFDAQTNNFNNKVSGFVQNFLSAADQLNPSLDAVGRTFAQLSITGISTNEQFAARVKLELQAGNNDTVAKLLSVADAFNTVTSSVEKTRNELMASVNKNAFSSMGDFKAAQARAASGASDGAASMIQQATVSGGAAMSLEQAANDAQNKIDANKMAKAAALAALNTAKAIPERTGDYYGDGGRVTMAGYDKDAAEWNAQHAEEVAKLQDAYNSLPAFANGGDHTGGWRIIGEKGPELEYTGPSRIVSNDNTKSLFDSSGVIDEIKALRTQVATLISNQVRENALLANYARTTADVLESSAGGGPLMVRIA